VESGRPAILVGSEIGQVVAHQGVHRRVVFRGAAADSRENVLIDAQIEMIVMFFTYLLQADAHQRLLIASVEQAVG
jgi:hypothetical protein